MLILGLSAFYHDSAAALVEDGRIIAAAQEERFSRLKHDAGFPIQAIEFCLQRAGTTLSAIDHVVFYDKPFLKFERLLETYLAFAPRGFRSFRTAMPVWLKDKLFQKTLLRKALRQIDPAFDAKRLLFCEHHVSHAASAFFASPFEHAAVLTMDGVGEWTTTSTGIGAGNSLTIHKEIAFPHSIGLLYSAFTTYCGFKVNSGEYKLMGLAPYGAPRYATRILDHLIDLKQDGSFRLDMQYFDYCTGLGMTNRRFDELFGGPARREPEPLLQRHMDLAASIQSVTEEIVLRLTRALAAESGAANLCMAGGVALNCVANARVRDDGRFERVWVQPAAGDAGGALGAALAGWHMSAGGARVLTPGADGMSGAYLGPEFSDADIAARLTATGARFRQLDPAALLDAAATDLAAGLTLGWFQGRMEFGPRALGARSILADPRSSTMQSSLNLQVKFRESFRPFAPAIRLEDVGEWFTTTEASPYMMMVANVHGRHRCAPPEAETQQGLARLGQQRSDIPAVTHVDGSARLQTVDGGSNPLFYALLTRFKRITGCPILVNTSFNVRSEPIVCTPEDAFRCFMSTGIERLAIGGCYLHKQDQPAELRIAYADQLEPD